MDRWVDEWMVRGKERTRWAREREVKKREQDLVLVGRLE